MNKLADSPKATWGVTLDLYSKKCQGNPMCMTIANNILYYSWVEGICWRTFLVATHVRKGMCTLRVQKRGGGQCMTLMATLLWLQSTLSHSWHKDAERARLQNARDMENVIYMRNGAIYVEMCVHSLHKVSKEEEYEVHILLLTPDTYTWKDCQVAQSEQYRPPMPPKHCCSPSVQSGHTVGVAVEELARLYSVFLPPP
jgi:hypothetical protein